MPAKTFRPGDCYSTLEMIALYVPHADVNTPAGRHRAGRSLLFARQNKGLPHVYFGTRTIMYPRTLIDRWLAAHQRNCEN